MRAKTVRQKDSQIDKKAWREREMTKILNRGVISRLLGRFELAMRLLGLAASKSLRLHLQTLLVRKAGAMKAATPAEILAMERIWIGVLIP
jgi:hypothetical protein